MRKMICRLCFGFGVLTGLGSNADSFSPPLGATYRSGQIHFRLYSERATHVEVYLYTQAFGAEEVTHLTLNKDANNVWGASVTLADLHLDTSEPLYYGYRVWGPNWEYDPAWKKGSLAGLVTDVDADGNRFNPNKLLLDPYAREVSHDPIGPRFHDYSYYQSGLVNRGKDSGPVAAKGLILWETPAPTPSKITRAFKDDVIYEVHVKGFTASDSSLPAAIRGTYKGAAQKARYLKDLGVTAVEFLPVQETHNEQNAGLKTTDGMNYWGYMTLNYFSPDRQYSSDRSPGGPTREFREMVQAFHAQGIKVFIDVVYNHTSEGGTGGDGTYADLLSYRGIDNPTYYLLSADKRFYWDNTGTGHDLNCAHKVVRDLVVDSLKYWHDELGVDGFRFDLAPVLGNSLLENGFNFDKMDQDNALNRLTRELPARADMGGPGVDLIAEPWTVSSVQQGQFPWGWAEWNGSFRDVFRKHQNKRGIDAVTPAMLARKFSGSADIFQADGRKPWRSVNFMDAHDGFTLADIYRYNSRNNWLPWPDGPSDGGHEYNDSWDQGGDYAMQRQAARNGLAFLMLSSGVPMIQGGDEFLRTLKGNNNAYNLDSPTNWIDWSQSSAYARFLQFTKRMLAFRRAHPALRPLGFFDGRDHNGNGLKDITWHMASGAEPDGTDWDNPSNEFLAFRIDASEFADESIQSIYVAYNGSSGGAEMSLPKPWDPLESTCRHASLSIL